MSFDPFTLAVGAGLSILNMLVRGRAPGPETIGWDQQPTPLASRGASVPVVIGRREVAPIMLWAGDRKSRKVSPGKSLGGGKGGDQRVYSEAAWWALATAPSDGIDKVHAIRVDGGKTIYEGPIERDAGSGVAIVLESPHPGNAYVYFGEDDQPVNPRLALGTGAGTEGVGVASRWPGLAYIDPRRMELGSSPVWGSLLVEIECRLNYDLGAAPAWIETLDGGGCHNIAHALYGLITEPFPFGAGLSCSRVNCAVLEEIGVRCATEGIGINLHAANAMSAAQACAEMLADAGALLLEPDGLLTASLIRDPDDDELDDLPVVGPSVYGSGGLRCVDEEPPGRVNRVMCYFKDREHGYRDMPSVRSSAGAAEVAGQVRPARIDLTTITNADVAARVSDRKSLELATGGRQVRFRADRGASELRPGDAFKLGVPGVGERLYSVLARQPRVLLDSAEITAAPLVYGRRAFFHTPTPPPAPPPPTALAEDPVFVPQELPYGLIRSVGDPDTPRLGVARVRGSEAVAAATILASDSGMSFVSLGTEQSSCFGGTLAAELPLTRTIVDRDGSLGGGPGGGPVIDQYNGDIDEAEDLSDDTLESQWLSGRQAVLIGEGEDAEICFVRGVSALGGGQHRLFGLVRARYDTAAKVWPAGTPVLFFKVASEARLRAFVAQPTVHEGATAHIKSVPFGPSGSIDAGDVDAETIPIVARSARPLPALNVRGNGGRPGQAEYSSGSDVRITWDYRVRDGGGSAAGEGGAGMKVNMVPHREGPFEVEIWSSATLRRTLTLDSDDTGVPDGSSGGVVYTAAMNSADHGGGPASFEARVWATRMGRRSRVAGVATVTLV